MEQLSWLIIWKISIILIAPFAVIFLERILNINKSQIAPFLTCFFGS